MINTVIKILKKAGLNKVYRQIEGVIPDRLNSEFKSLTFTPLVIKEEILPKYEEACKFLAEKIGRDAIGDYFEFGVSHGSSLNCMHKVLTALKWDHVRIFGFDSFEGMPPNTENEDGGRWKEGDFASPLEATSAFLTRNGIDWKRTFLIKGWYSATLTQDLIKKYNITKASIIMIDCDIYSSAKESLNFCGPLIKDTAVVLFDDWVDDKEVGEYRAWSEFLTENPHFKSEEFGTYKPRGKLFVTTRQPV